MSERPRPAAGNRPGRRPQRGAPIVRKNTVRLPQDIAHRIRAGHPWVYREVLGPRPMMGEPGTSIDIIDDEGEFVGRGLYDSDSSIALRVFTRNPDRAIDSVLISERVKRAVAMRKKLVDWNKLGCIRVLNAESDGLPGIVCERYGDYLVVQLFTSSVEKLRDDLYNALEAELSPKAIYEQRRYRSLAGDAPRQAGADLVRGVPAPVELEIHEDDLTFMCDVTAPLSTGLFADLREGRRSVRHWAEGRRVLNLFSYTGAISVYAHAGGAAEVVAVDVAAKAHARARRNFAASGFDPEKPEHIVGDTFKVLARFGERGRTFDLVVLDPPAFASAAARGGKPWSAVRDYAELIAASLSVLVPGGLLIAASSTHKMSASEFELALADGAEMAKTELQTIARPSLPPDFPTIPGFPEANYLKTSVAVRS